LKAIAEHELVELEAMRNDFRPLLLGMHWYAKKLYPDFTNDTHLIENARVDKTGYGSLAGRAQGHRYEIRTHAQTPQPPLMAPNRHNRLQEAWPEKTVTTTSSTHYQQVDQNDKG